MSSINLTKKRKIEKIISNQGVCDLTHSPRARALAYESKSTGQYYTIMAHLHAQPIESLVEFLKTLITTDYYYCEEHADDVGLHLQGWWLNIHPEPKNYADKIRRALKKQYPHLNKVQKKDSIKLSLTPVKDFSKYNKYVCKEDTTQWYSNVISPEMRNISYTNYHTLSQTTTPTFKRRKSAISSMIDQVERTYTAVRLRDSDKIYQDLSYIEAFELCEHVYHTATMMSGFNITKKAVETLLSLYNKNYRQMHIENLNKKLFQ